MEQFNSNNQRQLHPASANVVTIGRPPIPIPFRQLNGHSQTNGNGNGAKNGNIIKGNTNGRLSNSSSSSNLQAHTTGMGASNAAESENGSLNGREEQASEAPKEERLIVGVDFGTTYSGYDFAETISSMRHR